MVLGGVEAKQPKGSYLGMYYMTDEAPSAFGETFKRGTKDYLFSNVSEARLARHPGVVVEYGSPSSSCSIYAGGGRVMMVTSQLFALLGICQPGR